MASADGESAVKADSRSVLITQIVLSFSFVTFLLFPNFSAQWGLIDDHEIMAFLGTRKDLSFREIPGLLMKTEAGRPGDGVRYRPTYYLLRLVETAVWSKTPSLWYAFRIFILGIWTLITWRLLGRFLGTIMGGLCCLLLLSHRFWADVLCQLGPAEAYCVVPLALFFLGFVELWRHKRPKADSLWWGILVSSAVIAVGAKENFLFLLPISAALFAHVWRRNRPGSFSIFLNGLLVAFGLFITIAVILGLRKHGADVYLNPVDLSHRLQVLKSGVLPFTHWKIQLPFWISLVLLVVSATYRKSRPNSERVGGTFRELKRLFWIQSALLSLWYLQFVFYNGAWPNGTRYDFPGVLASDLAYLVLLSSPIRILRLYPESRSPRHCAYAMLAGFLIFLIVQSGFKELRFINDASRLNRETTRIFTQSLLRIVEEVRRDPGVPIIFESHRAWDLEPVYSLRRFLSAYGVSNPLFLKLEGWSEKACQPGLEVTLARALQRYSEGGVPEDDGLLTHQNRFYPIREFPQGGACSVISFSGDSTLACRNLGRIW